LACAQVQPTDFIRINNPPITNLSLARQREAMTGFDKAIKAKSAANRSQTANHPGDTCGNASGGDKQPSATTDSLAMRKRPQKPDTIQKSDKPKYLAPSPGVVLEMALKIIFNLSQESASHGIIATSSRLRLLLHVLAKNSPAPNCILALRVLMNVTSSRGAHAEIVKTPGLLSAIALALVDYDDAPLHHDETHLQLDRDSKQISPHGSSASSRVSLSPLASPLAQSSQHPTPSEVQVDLLRRQLAGNTKYYPTASTRKNSVRKKSVELIFEDLCRILSLCAPRVRARARAKQTRRLRQHQRRAKRVTHNSRPFLLFAI